ncbi:NAD-dependent succinate-semialdehyde dehydrogenase [Oceanobacillus oncorhynchi]|uniref:NAD-dependent succinate-semialdehyde dehydrogenase n=1 Tax=Oceanobacillus oncorhynchi TaxID=545501 RepID=UPI0034D75CA8
MNDYLEVLNPATGDLIERIKIHKDSEIIEKIRLGHDAFKQWANLDAYKRFGLLNKWSGLIKENKVEIAKVMTLESGKPLSESLNEVDYAASYIDWYAEEGKRVYGRSIPSSSVSKKAIVSKEPLGLVGAITPWNFPAAMMTRKAAPALAAGCTFIVKPAGETPITTIKLVKLAHQAGIPKTAVQFVIGSGKLIGDLFTNSKLIRKITFTGSTSVGKELIKQSATNVQHVSMELGGHAPFIIARDADLDFAVKQLILSKFRNSGQTCICANRILVHEDIADSFTEKLKKAVTELQVGNGLEEDVQVGPVINRKSYEKIKFQIEDAVSKGAKVVIGNKYNVNTEKDTYFVYPTILANVTDKMDIMQEETFGPVAPIAIFKNNCEAVAIANSTPFGLAAYFFTNDYRTGMYFHDQLKFGIIGWNDGSPSAAYAPFGGLKESGLGREGGLEGIEMYLETKYLSIGNLS